MKIAVTQVTDQKYWSGLTKPMHLAWAGLNKPPSLINEVIENLYELNYGDDNLVSHIEKYPTKYVDQETYEWMLRGSSERNIPLIKATYQTTAGTEIEVTASTTAQVGLNNTPFFLYFPENYFFCPGVLAGMRAEDYLVRIIEDPIQQGSYWKYKVQMYGAGNSLYMPVDEILPNTLWSDMFAPVERDFSKRGTDLHFESFFKLQNTMSTIRKKYAVPGSMIHRGGNIPLLFKFQGDDGKIITKWIDKIGWEFHHQMRRDKAKLLLYGKSTIDSNGISNIMGESGNPVIAGFGLYEQMAGSNIEFYNQFSIDAFSDFLLQLSVGKLPEDKRKFLVTTGEFGKVQFHKAAKQAASQMSWLRSDHNFKNGGATLDESQILEYIFLNGIEIKLMVDPMLDSPVTVGKIKHPSGGYLSSYIYNIWDFGTDSGEPNIQKIAIKGNEEYTVYVAGMRDPFTPGGMGQNMTPAANAVDGYEVHKMVNASVRIKNPLRTGRYMPNSWRGVV
jgi:hypothetical protein